MSSPLRRVRTGAIVLAVVFTVAVISYRLAGRSWLDAVYMVVITISTVGYGETSSLEPAQKWVTMLVILFGISAAVFTVGGVLQMMMEGEIQRAMHLGRTTRAIDKLERHVIVCGFGRIGQILAQELSSKKLPFVVVDNNPEAIAEAQRLDYLVLQGDATDEAVLVSAGVSRASTLVAALPNDAASVFIALTSRNLNRTLNIIARGEFQTTEKKLLQAGANRVVMPAALGALRMAAMVTRPSTVELLELTAGQRSLDVEVEELVIGAGSTLKGRTPLDAIARRQHKLLVVAVKAAQGELIFNPGLEVTFQAGDTIIVMGRVEHIDQFRREYAL